MIKKEEIRKQLLALIDEIAGIHLSCPPEDIEENLNVLRMSIKYCLFDREAL